MTQQNRPPALYVTSAFLANAHERGIAGATAHDSAYEVIRRGSAGRLQGPEVGRIILHDSFDLGDPELGLYGSNATSFEANNMHPRQLIQDGLPEVHSLVVPVEGFGTTDVAWALHKAAAHYGGGSPTSEGPAEDSVFGALLDGSGPGLPDLLGRVMGGMQPPKGGQASQGALAEAMLSTLRSGAAAIQAVQRLPDNPNTHQPPLSPFTSDEMSKFVAQNLPPIVFHLQ